jgi:hypothetical protein
MGRSETVVGNPDPEPNLPTVKKQAENADRPRPSKPRQQQMCGAMNEQRSDYGGYSQPQGFVRLVGYRDPKVRPARAPS